ncbi:MAG: hypothetical protein K1X75_04725 [Leptospirales bacterium]|nr:hypothetical protein [Leptospirales bacterium]
MLRWRFLDFVLAATVLTVGCFQPVLLPQAVHSGEANLHGGEYFWSDGDGRWERRTRRDGIELTLRGLSAEECGRLSGLLDVHKPAVRETPPGRPLLLRALNVDRRPRELAIDQVLWRADHLVVRATSLSDYAREIYSPALAPFVPSAFGAPRRNGYFLQHLPDWQLTLAEDTVSASERSERLQRWLQDEQRRLEGWRSAQPGDEIRALLFFDFDRRCNPCRLELPGEESWFPPLDLYQPQRGPQSDSAAAPPADPAEAARLEDSADQLDQSLERQLRAIRRDRLDLLRAHRQRQEHFRLQQKDPEREIPEAENTVAP